MADQANQTTGAGERRLSFTQRLVGQGKDWMSGFHTSVEKDDQLAGVGFNDPVDDFVPGVYTANSRRRNSSVSSEEPVDLNGVRRGSITERISGLQLQRKPKSNLESFAVGFATVVDDQS